MDIKSDIQVNNDAYHHETMADHVHKHGSKHGYNVAGEEQDDGMAMHGHGMMGKAHKMADMEHMQMHSTFHLKTDSDFLIEGIKISSVQGIVLAMLFTMAITISLDSLKIIMQKWEKHKGDPKKAEVHTRKRNWRLLVTGTSHVLSVSLGYIMMLCVMTMNVWLMVSVVLGSGLAYFIVRPLLSWKLEGLSDNSIEYNTERTAEEAEPFNHRHDFPGNSKCEDNIECLLLGNDS